MCGKYVQNVQHDISGGKDMPRLDHHRDEYDEETLVKLDLYKKYLQAWLPVFLNLPKLHLSRLQIFDFFAGPGHDIKGTKGSPLIALDAVQEALSAKNTCSLAVHLYLNELDVAKYDELRRCCQAHPFAKQVHLHFLNKDFSAAFDEWSPLFEYSESGRTVAANLVFFDQSGTKEVNEKVFKKVVSATRTDFLFFIASSYMFRFQEQNFSGTPVEKEDLDGMTMRTFHRKVCDAYRRWLPQGLEYYLAPFSLAKDGGANIYGLIFGSAHPAGINKFLTICWKKDELRGEANYDIDSENINSAIPSLFSDWNVPNKIKVFEAQAEELILKGKLRTNIAVFKYALTNGFLAEHAKSLVNRLIAEEKLPKQKLRISYAACGYLNSVPEEIRLIKECK